MPIIHWFRRDFRLHDNTALFHAASDATDGVIPVFIFDDAILRHPDTGAPIVAFMLGCLEVLRDNLRSDGGDLLFLHGDPVDQLRRLVRATGASAVYYNKDYAPGAIERDEQVERTLGEMGAKVVGYKDQVIFEEQELLSASSGNPYTVYTPYKNAWLAKLAGMGLAEQGPEPIAKRKFDVPQVAAKLARSRAAEAPNVVDLPTAKQLGFDLDVHFEIDPGEDAARKRLRHFCTKILKTYHDTRNLPAIDGTSRLSPHLRHGTLSPRQCLRAALWSKKEGGASFARGVETWIGELIWRDFYQQVLFNFPHVETDPFKTKLDLSLLSKDRERFEKWWRGQTGYPIVDAAQRQLNTTGWMHNRLRMITAMFMTKDLLIDYRLGERYFMQHLIDGETAQNNGGWQWSAGTGTDAQPWFRIFNPTTQSEKFDPDGVFIRRFCPELARVPTEFIHAPHRMDESAQKHAECIIGRDYPLPIIDHADARKAALALLKRGKLS